jgi:hypothetical protein
MEQQAKKAAIKHRIVMPRRYLLRSEQTVERTSEQKRKEREKEAKKRKRVEDRTKAIRNGAEKRESERNLQQ